MEALYKTYFDNLAKQQNMPPPSYGSLFPSSNNETLEYQEKLRTFRETVAISDTILKNMTDINKTFKMLNMESNELDEILNLLRDNTEKLKIFLSVKDIDINDRLLNNLLMNTLEINKSLSNKLDELQEQIEDHRIINSIKMEPFIFPEGRNFVLKKYNKQQDFSDTCVYCLSKFRFEESIYRTKCRHIVHEECMNEWLENNNKCPICSENFV